MKKITIYQENNEPIVLDDDDDKTDIKEYVKNLSKVLESNNVVRLHLTSRSLVLRPNKISLISVENIPTTEPLAQQEPANEEDVIPENSEEQKTEEPEDIISD